MKFIDVLNCTNVDNSIIENVRAIYLNLGKIISYDERFIYGENKELLHSIYGRDINIEQDESSKIVCNSINKVFLQLLNKMQYLIRLIKFTDKTAGIDEMKKFYQKLFCASVLDKFESKKFNAFEYYKEDDLRKCIYHFVLRNNFRRWTYVLCLFTEKK